MGNMALDPQIAGFLQFIEQAGYPPMHEGNPDDARKAFRAMTVDLVTPESVEQVGEVRELQVPGAAGERDARLYLPEGDGPWPTTLYLHGGGFVIGDLDTHDQTCRRLCRDADTAVLSYDYRLAPEHPFPAAADDVVAAVGWVGEHRDELGGGRRIAVAGDSAGGNLAAVAAQARPDVVDVQLLLYPATDALTERPSRVENATGYFLELATMEWFFGHYVSEESQGEDPRVSPLRAESLAGQPCAIVVTAELDPLRDEGEAYADRLATSGVPVDRVRYDGLIHGFLDMVQLSDGARAAYDDVAGRFRRKLHG
jgi:acetyl esterase